MPFSTIRASKWRCWQGSVLALVVCLAPLSSGCSLFQSVGNYISYNDSCNDFVIGWRNTVWARQAWHERKHHFAEHCQLGTFGAGFRAGYRAVASGGNGCPPPLPPRSYWTWKYQTPEGQNKVAAWFEGYPYGAKAAEEEMAGAYQNIQVSYLVEQEHSPEFQAGEIPQIDHPIPQEILQDMRDGEVLQPGLQLAPPEAAVPDPSVLRGAAFDSSIFDPSGVYQSRIPPRGATAQQGPVRPATGMPNATPISFGSPTPAGVPSSSAVRSVTYTEKSALPPGTDGSVSTSHSWPSTPIRR